MAESYGARRPIAGFGRLVEPLRILFDNRSLTWLVVGFGAMTLAEWGYVTALAVDAYRSHGSVAVGLVGFRLFVASLASFFNVPFLERHPKGSMLSGIAATRAVIIGLSAALAGAGAPLAPLLVLVALDALVSAPYRSAQSAVLPVLARTPRELAAAAAGMSTVKTLSQALGAIAGGFLLVVTTPMVVFSGAAGLMLLAAATTVQFKSTPIRVSGSGSSEGLRGLVKDSVGVVHHPYVGGLLVVSGLRTFVRGMWIAIAVIASLRLLHAGSAGVGLLMLAAGVGALAAVPLSAALIGRKKLGTPTIAAFVACGIPLVIIAGVPVFDVALFFVATWGVGMAVADVATFSLLHRLLDSPLLPRVTGAIESVKLALEGLGALVGPVLVSTIGIRWALALAGVPLPAVVVVGRKLLHRLDSTASARADVLAVLHGVPFLETLDMAGLESLAGRVTRLSVPAGTEVVRQGDPGTASMSSAPDGPRSSSTAFGRRGRARRLLRREGTAAQCASDGHRRSSRSDGLARLAAGGLCYRADRTGRSRVDACRRPPLSRHTQHDRAPAGRCPLASKPPLPSRRQLASPASGQERRRALGQGAPIIRRGEQGDRFFVMLDGRAVVSAGSEAITELHPGDQFGEIALLHGVARRAT